MFVYRSKQYWNNSALYHLCISALMWLPVAIVATMAILGSESKGYSSGALFIVITLLAWALFLFKRAQSHIHFPAIEVSSSHLILNRPMYKRSVYNLKDIKNPRFFSRFLYFKYLGWPVITPFALMPKETQFELLEMLRIT